MSRYPPVLDTGNLLSSYRKSYFRSPTVTLVYGKYFVKCNICGINTYPYMVIPLIILNCLDLEMSNVLLLDRKSYLERHLGISTYLSYVWLFYSAVFTPPYMVIYLNLYSNGKICLGRKRPRQ